MKIKQIFDEIASESSTNQKMVILSKYKENELLKRVLYLANSKRIKFYIKQIPHYETVTNTTLELKDAVEQLLFLSKRKLTGQDGIDHLSNILSHIDKDDAYIIERIIEKDCKIGMGTSNINKVWANFIEKTGYMGCKPFSIDLINRLLKNGSCYSQEKMDGRFVNVIVTNGNVEMESRQGEPTILDNPKFVNELSKLKDCVFNGELTMKDIDRYQSNGIISSLISISTKLSNGIDVSKEIDKFESKHMPFRDALDLIIFTGWDELTIDEYYDRKSNIGYEDRFSKLKNTLNNCENLKIVEYRIVNSIDEIINHFKQILNKNGEGTVVKSLDGLWVDSKPSYQIKVKKEINFDLKIVGFNYGTGKNSKLISSVNVESSDGLLKTSPTGIDEDEMIYITNNQNSLLMTILEVKCSGLSRDNNGNYSLLHPVYIRLRTDKSIANSLKECIEIDESTSMI